MTTYECLEELFEEEMQEVFLYSANYLMTMPKKGLESEWTKHRERADILQSLLDRKEGKE